MTLKKIQFGATVFVILAVALLAFGQVARTIEFSFVGRSVSVLVLLLFALFSGYYLVYQNQWITARRD